MLLRDKEEENTVKGLKNSIEKSRERYNEAWEENEYLKAEIEKLGEELDRNRNEYKKDDRNRELLGELFEKGIIDEDGNILQHNDQ